MMLPTKKNTKKNTNIIPTIVEYSSIDAINPYISTPPLNLICGLYINKIGVSPQILLYLKMSC